MNILEITAVSLLLFIFRRFMVYITSTIE